MEKYDFVEPEVTDIDGHVGIRYGGDTIRSFSDDKGNICINININLDDDPSVSTYVITAKSDEELRKEIYDLLAMSFDDMGVEHCDRSFSQYVADFIDNRAYKYDASYNKDKRKAFVGMIFDHFKDRDIEDIWYDDIEEWADCLRKNMGFRTYEKSHAFTVMRQALQNMYLNNKYPYDASRHVGILSGHHHRFSNRKPISDELFRHILSQNNVMSDLTVLNFMTLTRRSECTALSELCIDHDVHVAAVSSQIKKSERGDLERVTYTKGRRSKRVYYDKEFEKFFDRLKSRQASQKEHNLMYNNGDDLMITTADGSPIDPDNYAKWMNNITDGKASPHDIRRLAATVIYESRREEEEFTRDGVTAIDNQKLLESIASDMGHMDSRTTSVYILSSNAGLREIRRKTAMFRSRAVLESEI